MTGANRGMGRVLDGIESGANEVLADEMTRHIRAELGKPTA